MPPLFLGTLLLQDGPTGEDRYEILDGQQRLLTITLICIWACNILRLNGLVTFSDLIAKNYLGKYDEVENLLVPRICPDPRDQKALKSLLKISTEIDWNFEAWTAASDLKSSNALVEQFSNIDIVFGSQIHCAYRLLDCKPLFSLLNRVLQVSHVCQFVLAHADDPFDTFQRLNHRGKKLQNADLIRSEVLKKCTKEQIQQYYEKKWIGIEKLVGEASSGGASEYKKSRLDRFFTCYAKARMPGTKKNQSVIALEKYWKKKTPEQIHEDLEIFSKKYRVLYDFEYSHVKYAIENYGTDMATSILILSMLNPPDDFGPFVMRMLEVVENDLSLRKPVKECIDLLSGWYVRNWIIATGSTTLFGLQSVFNQDSWKRLESGKFGKDILFDAMDRKEYALGQLSDEAFLDGLQSKNVYGSKICKALVFAIDTLSKFGLNLKQSDSRVQYLECFQMDHVAPQKWKSANFWKDEAGLDGLVDKIGNLVAVESKLNQEAHVKSFKDRAILFHNQSSFKVARDLRTLPDSKSWDNDFDGKWGEKAIRFRTEEYSKELVSIFRFPYKKSTYE